MLLSRNAGRNTHEAVTIVFAGGAKGGKLVLIKSSKILPFIMNIILWGLVPHQISHEEVGSAEASVTKILYILERLL